MFSRSARGRLTDKDLGRFPGDTLFHGVARGRCATLVACPARSCTRPGKWRDGCAGAFGVVGLSTLGQGTACWLSLMLLLDNSSPDAVVVDTVCPPRRPKYTKCWCLPGRGCRPHRLRRRRARTDRASRYGCRRVVSCLWGADRRGAASRGCRAGPGGGAPCCHDLDRGDTGRLSGWGRRTVGDRYPAGDASGPAGISHLDAGTTRRDYGKEPSPVGCPGPDSPARRTLTLRQLVGTHIIRIMSIRILWVSCVMAVCGLGLAGPAAAQCEPEGDIRFVCGPISPEDLALIPETPWVP